MGKYALLDFDKTLSSTDLMPDVYMSMEKDGLIENYSEHAKELAIRYARGEISYNERAYLGWHYNIRFLCGFKVKDYLNYVQNRFKGEQYISPWANTLLKLLKDHNFRIIIITASLQEAVKTLTKHLNADAVIGTTVKIVNGVFTDEIIEIVNGEIKAKIASKYIHESDYSIGLGDSAGDFEMLRLTNRAFLYNPKPEIAELAVKESFIYVNESNIISAIEKTIAN